MRNFKPLLAGLCFVLVFAVVGIGSGHAVPFSFEHNTTISSTTIDGLSAGQAVKITVTLDNGNATNTSQVWTAGDAVSIEWDFNNGGLVTTFTTPFQGGFDNSDGSFITNGAGTLTSVMSDWSDFATSDFTTNGAATEFTWFLNGANPTYFESNFSFVSLSNIGELLNPAAWSQVSSIPEPGTLALFGLGLVGLGRAARRKRRA